MFRSYKFQLAAVLVTLGMAASVSSHADGIFAPSYNADTVFTDGLGGTTMGLTFDGANYYSVSGGGTNGVREAQYTAAGAVSAAYSPGLDFRSIFIGPGGAIQARQFNDGTIYTQTAPGSFAPTLTLAGGVPDSQSSVVFDSSGNYDAMTGGTVSRWTAAGAALPSVALSGYGAIGTESDFAASRGLATVDNYWLTYADGTLSAWDFSGNRVGTTTLNGAGASFDSDFGFSYANGQAFVIDEAGGSWSGYNVGFSTAATPEPGSIALLTGMGLSGGIFAFRRRRRAH